MLYITGDCHGNVINRLSYKNYPHWRELNQLNSSSNQFSSSPDQSLTITQQSNFVFILGDVGLGWPGYEKDTDYQLKALSRKPFTIICIAGNHDNYDYLDTLPLIFPSFLLKGEIKETPQYPNILWIDRSAILNINEKTILCIAGAKSHDTKYIFEPSDKLSIKRAKKHKIPYRINHKTWWEREAIDVPHLKNTLSSSIGLNYIFSHDAPAKFNKIAKELDPLNSYQDNEGELYLDLLDNTLQFDHWYHGHYHFENLTWLKNHTCIYYKILELC